METTCHFGYAFCESDDLCNRCVKRNLRLARNATVATGKLDPFYIAAIGISRAYGGPEEGGWYYDVTQHLEVRQAYTWRQGLRHARELKELYPTCKRGRYSVIGGDDTYVISYHNIDRLPEQGPFNRPRYE